MDDHTPDDDLRRRLAAAEAALSEKTDLETALLESKERLHVALASANLGTFVWHVAEDRTEEDARARAHFGLPPDGTISLAEALATTFHPDDGPRYAAAVARAVDPAGPGTLHEEYRIRRPDGEERWMSTSAITTFEGTPRSAVRLTGVLSDVTERKRAEAMLRANEERQAFLLKLGDALRLLADPIEVMGVASEMLGRHLGAGRCGYGEVDEAGEWFTVERDWTDGIMPSFVGRHFFDGFGPELVARYRSGRSVLIDDALADARAAGHEAAFEAAGGVRAALGLPLIKKGRFVAGFFVQQLEPRHWTTQDEALALDVAERTWAAVESARAEAALRESEEKYRTLFENMGQGYALGEVIRDEEGRAIDLRYLELNPAFERLSGIPVAQAQGRTVREVYGEVEPEWFEAAERVARLKVPERVEYEIGAIGRWFQMHFYPTEGDRYLGLYEEVTERKRAEAVLRESEERQAFLLKLSDALRAEEGVEAVGDLACRLIAETLGLERVYLVAVPPEDGDILVTHEVRREDMPALRGSYRRSEFPNALSEIFKRTIVYDDVRTDPRLSDLDRTSFTGLGAVGFVAAPIRRGSETMIWAAGGVSTRPRSWTAGEVALFEDAIERTWAAVERARAEAALRESEARFTQFAEASSGGLWIRDAATLAMEFTSPAIGTIYGVEPDAILGEIEKWAAMVVPEDRAAALRHIEAARGGASAVHEYRIQRPSDGTFRWIRDIDFPLGQDGRIGRIGGIAEDVTEAKLSVEHQGVLLAELQHRVRNIMGMIRSMANRTAPGALNIGEYRSLLEGRLLALARVQALLTREANAGGSLRSIVESEVAAQAHHGGQFELRGPDVRLSPKAVEVLTLAFHELATNALKYGALSVPEGRLSVSWAPVEKRGAPWLALEWTERGAPPHAPSKRRGFGSELIEGRIPYELGGQGRITIDPAGARCHLEFPLGDGASILETDAPQPATIFGGTLDMTGAPDLSGRTILVVEDDYYMASDTAAALRGAGAEVLGPCPSVEATLDLLEDATPTHAVLDLNLGGGGPRFEIAKLLRARGVPFVFLTGYDPAVIPKELEAVVRLQKPVPFLAIVDAVAGL